VSVQSLVQACVCRLSGNRANLLFVGIVLLAFLLTFLSAPQLLVRPEGWTLVVFGAAYLALGLAGPDFCAGRPGRLAAYFGAELALSTAMLYLSSVVGAMWLLPLPVVGQGASVLPRRGTTLVGGLVVLSFMAVLWAHGVSMASVVQAGMSMLAGVIFVAFFTELAVAEQRARIEVERLNAELETANEKLRAYAAQAEELATTRERNRLAREIHDSLGHYLTVINVQLAAAQAVLESDRPRALDALRQAQTLAQEGLADVRRSVAALRAGPTAGRPLPETVAELADEARAAGLAVTLDVQGAPCALAPQAELTLYRAAQEALTNVRKHARAARVDVTLAYEPARVRLSVADDGVGASLQSPPQNGGEREGGGFGLIGVRERAALLGGALRTQSAPGEGFRLEVELPR
jgi:signal transduction histidine kinase